MIFSRLWCITHRNLRNRLSIRYRLSITHRLWRSHNLSSRDLRNYWLSSLNHWRNWSRHWSQSLSYHSSLGSWNHSCYRDLDIFSNHSWFVFGSNDLSILSSCYWSTHCLILGSCSYWSWIRNGFGWSVWSSCGCFICAIIVCGCWSGFYGGGVIICCGVFFCGGITGCFDWNFWGGVSVGSGISVGVILDWGGFVICGGICFIGWLSWWTKIHFFLILYKYYLYKNNY